MAHLPWLGEWATPEAIAGVLRPLFLDTVSRLVPAALEALRDDVLPVYQRAGTAKEPSTRGGDYPEGESQDDAPTYEYTSWERTPLPELMFYSEQELESDRSVFTDEEASILFDLGYELLGDPGVTGPARSYTWRPKEGFAPAYGPPDDPYEDCDEQILHLARLRDALRAWGERFYLSDQWILDNAWRQLDAWHWHWYLAYPHCKWPRVVKAASAQDKEPMAPPLSARARQAADSPEGETIGPVRLEWLLLPPVTWFLPTSADERRLSYEHEGWDPTAARRAAARRHILADFERFLDEYLDGMESYVLMEQEKWRRTPAYTALEKHMEWLVRYQCQGESFPDIDRSASDYKYATGETVEKPVRRLAKLMDVQLRPGTRGRPPRSKNRPKRKSRP